MQKKIQIIIFVSFLIIFMFASYVFLYDYFPSILLIESCIVLGAGIALITVGFIKLLKEMRIPVDVGVVVGRPTPLPAPSSEKAGWQTIGWGLILILFGAISLLIVFILELL